MATCSGSTSFAVVTLVLIVVSATTAKRPSEDKIQSLPGVNFKIKFEQYSGYLKAGNDNYFHYWYVDSQSNPSKDPLILFLNGGPGCSSMVALLTECGPYRIQGKAKVVKENVYAWNKIANIIFLESPAGAGFSFYNGSALVLNDEQSTIAHYAALASFYQKFPEFVNRTFFLVGQSYAAVYVTMLAEYIQNHAKEFPGDLQGVAIGNGLLSLPLIISSRFYYNYYHSLLEEKAFFNVLKTCCQNQDQWKCDLSKHYMAVGNPPECHNMTISAIDNIPGRDPFNIQFECYKRTGDYQDDEECGVPFGNITKHYLDQPEVRKAMHIDINKFQHYSFDACSASIKANYTTQVYDLKQKMQKVLNGNSSKSGQKMRILIINGDTDSYINFIGAQWFVDSLNRTVTSERRPWYYNGISQPNVGYQQNYEGLDYVIVRGAGHYVPADRPRETLQLFANFLRAEHNYSKPDGVDVTPAPLTSGASSKRFAFAALLVTVTIQTVSAMAYK